MRSGGGSGIVAAPPWITGASGGIGRSDVESEIHRREARRDAGFDEAFRVPVNIGVFGAANHSPGGSQGRPVNP